MVAIGGIADIVQHRHEMARSRVTQSNLRSDAAFSPYHSAHLSRYDAVHLSMRPTMRRWEFRGFLGGEAAT